MSKSRDLGEFPAAALDIDASGNLDVTGTVTADGLVVDGAVGIGTSFPSAPIHIKSSIGNSQVIAEYGLPSVGTGQFGLMIGSNSQTSLIYDSLSSLSIGASYNPVTGAGYSEKVRISSSGNVGIGVVPEAWRANDFIGLQVGTGAAVYGRGSGDEDKSGLASNAYYDNNNDRWQYIATKAATNYYQVSGQHLFQVAASGTADSAISWSEAMRIDNQGRLLLNTSSAIFGANEALHIEGIVAGTASYGIFAHGSSSTNYFLRAYNGSNLSGSISYTANGLFLTSVSDERLKENISNANDAGERIDAINVRQFDWKQSGDHQEYGMIAQELIKVAPDAVHAPEDPEDMMGVDYAKLVPMLIKEVQSLRARVSALESN